MNLNRLDSPDKNKKLGRKTGHWFLGLIIRLQTRVQKHLYSCKETCGTLAATKNAGFVTHFRLNYRIILLSRDMEEQEQLATKRSSYE